MTRFTIREDVSGWSLSGARVSVDGVEVICLKFSESEGWADIPRCTDAGKFDVDPANIGAVLVDRIYGVVRET